MSWRYWTRRTGTLVSETSPADGPELTVAFLLPVWRQKFETEDTIIETQVAHDGQCHRPQYTGRSANVTFQTVILTVSGVPHDVIRCFSSQTGHLLWEVVASPGASPRQLYQPSNLGTAIAVSDGDLRSSDFYVLTDGRKVQRLARSTGEVKWVWESEVAGSVPFRS
jgi:outer membrane protein assembly factor BamB